MLNRQVEGHILLPVLNARMMKPDSKRQWLSRILLAVYLMVLSVNVLHVHEHEARTDVACQDCAHHIKHEGHINEAAPSSCVCLLCDFLSLTYLSAQMLAFSVVATVLAVYAIGRTSRVVGRAVGEPRLRAPPGLSC